MKRSLGLHHDFPFGRLRACSRAWPSHLGEQEGLQLDPVTSKELSIKFDDFQPDKEELSHQAMHLGEGGELKTHISTTCGDSQSELTGACVTFTVRRLQD